MSKFCSKCGAEIQDGIKFCAGCGASTEEAQATTQDPAVPAPAVAKKPVLDLKNKNTLLGVVAIAGVLFIILVVLLFNVIFGGYKGAVKDFAKARSNSDSIDLDSVMTYGKGVKVKIDIKDKEKFDKRDVETIQEYYEEVKFDGKKYKGADKIKVSKAYVVDTEMTTKGSEDDEDKDVSYLVVKVNGKWYVEYFPLKDCGDADDYIEQIEDSLDGKDDVDDYLDELEDIMGYMD